MSLIDRFSEPYKIMVLNSTADGEGGYTATWTEGKTINAAVLLDTSVQAMIGQAHGLTETYTVTVSRDITLKYHDVIKRISDGAVFRITSNGSKKATPEGTDLDMNQVSAEGWKLT